MGPWQTPWGITSWLRYIDSSGNENWLAASDSGPYARYFSSSLIDDSSTVVAKLVRTKKEDFGEWHTFKIIKIFDALFRNVRGAVTVNIRLETKDGNTVTTKSFNLTSSLGIGGWGGDEWGQAKFGNTAATVSLTGDELVRWAQLYKLARVMQVEVQTTAANSNFEFLSIRTTAQSLGDSSLPASTRV